MNRLILVFLIMAASISIGLAEDQYVNYQTYNQNGFDLYFQPSGTETHARYMVTSGSITLSVTNGTTYYQTFLLTDPDVSTFALFKSSLASVADLDTTSHQGSWIVSIPETVSPAYKMTALDVVTISSNCFSSANAKTLNLDVSSTTLMSFVPRGRNSRKIKIKYAIANVTGTSPTITIYDHNGTAMTPSASMTSGSPLYFGVEDTNHPLAIGYMNQPVSVRVVTTDAMTAGYLMVGYSIE